MSNDLATRMRALDHAVVEQVTLRDDRQRRVDALKTEIDVLQAEAKLIEQAENVLIELGKRTVGDSTSTLNKLVSLGLKLTFPDQDLELKTRIDKSRGKTAISFDLYDRGRTFPIDDSFGGGVLAIAGFLLRVSIITTLKMRRVLLLDETFAHLANEYIPNASALLRKIADELHFTIIMITHQPEFASSAHLRYKASRRGGVTIIKPVGNSSHELATD